MYCSTWSSPCFAQHTFMSRSSYTNSSVLIRQYNKGNSYLNCGPTVTEGSNTIVAVESKTFQSNGSWRYNLEHGIATGGPYSRDIIEIVRWTPGYANGSYKCGATWGPRYGIRQFATNIMQAVPSDASLENQALQNLRRSIAKKDSSINLIVPLAELKELRGTLDGAISSFERLLLATAAIKRRKSRQSLNEFFKVASDLWLTWSFGFKPMINDVQQILDTINKELVPQTVRFQGGPVSKTWFSTTAFQDWSWIGTNLSLVRYRVAVTHDLSVIYNCGCVLTPHSSNDYDAASSFNRDFGLTFGNIVPALYELVPYSWVIDYFTTMGDVISDTFQTDPFNTKWCYRTYRYNADIKILCVSPLNSLFRGTTLVPEINVLQKSIRRTTFSSIPGRSLRIKPLDSIAANWNNKLANLSSVLYQRIYPKLK